MSPAHLVYVDDRQPGISRRKVRHGWGYWDARGRRITAREEIERLNGVGMPPAYTDCWFCADPHGHIQATGKDARGRKQYRYHSEYRAAREEAKFDRCVAFGQALPDLRRQVASDLRKRSHCRSKAVAAVVRLLDLGRLRVGNEDYARENRSYGATTLRKHHAEVTGKRLQLEFRAKSGKLRTVSITDATLTRFAKRCQDLPGQHLFGWLDDAGAAHPVTSTDVNAYIHDAMGADFTAKHFRTWGASVIAYRALYDAAEPITLKAMLEPVTQALGNTPAIARKSYVHPDLIALAKDKDGQTDFFDDLRLPRTTRYLDRYERGLIAFLDPVDAAPSLPQAA
ncbi:DNA topoisomerase IB [Stakelama tenebrarum]|uniref:DNA topoisomerase n=1 Tax=Stakelama tenebrarum TaxID=2711215 RepID=A0A6G6Y835_9SPHN|nr:DNA topoisomerase IB [Sphingosinithalassobacter tenebrarum]QIG81104.1 DNA topoisomerase IB [Sphingosinithalassobacter tenebrarum]